MNAAMRLLDRRVVARFRQECCSAGRVCVQGDAAPWDRKPKIAPTVVVGCHLRCDALWGHPRQTAAIGESLPASRDRHLARAFALLSSVAMKLIGLAERDDLYDPEGAVLVEEIGTSNHFATEVLATACSCR